MSVAQAPSPDKVAFLFNANARHVTPKLVHEAQRAVGDANVYHSHSLQEAQHLTRRLVRRGYTRVVCGGGDGTLVSTVKMVATALQQSNARRAQRLLTNPGASEALLAPRRPPDFGLVCLGTGNALRRVVAAGAPARDVRRLARPAPRPHVDLPLIEEVGTDEQFLFAGVGFDAQALADYNRLRANLRRPVQKLASNAGGYAAAMLGRTLPRWVGHRGYRTVHVRTLGPAFYLDPKRRDAPVPLAAGSEIFVGKVGFVAAGTVPYLGYGIKMFPMAQGNPDMMQLRVASLSPWRMARHIVALWRGTYRSQRHLHDYWVSDVEVQFDRPAQYQHSGEERGQVRQVHWRVAPQRLHLTTNDCI